MAHPPTRILVDGRPVDVDCECDVCMPPCPDCGSKYTEQQADGSWVCLPCTDTTDISDLVRKAVE